MFGKLREKLAGFFKKKPEEEKPIAKAPKKEKKKPRKTAKKEAKKTAEELVVEVEPQIEVKEPKPKEEKPEKEEPEEEELGFFDKLVKRISTRTLTQEQFDEFFDEFEITLLENNVALEVVDKIKKELSEDLVGIEMKKKAEAKNLVMESLRNSITSVLIEPPDLEKQIKENKDSVYTILFFGINGSGKTTSIAKLAHQLKASGFSVVLGAADTFRAASIEQLETHGDRLGVKVIAQKYGADPAAVAFDTIAYAKKNKIKVALIDTAGRMYTKSDLLREMEKIVRVAKPNLKIFVGESITGNDAVEQARKFNESIGIDGIILAKADIDEKAGAILSVSHITKKPIYFLGVGQEYNDLQPFTKKTVLKNLGLE